MSTGALLTAIKAVEQHTEADPVGVLAALLSITSCALSRPRLIIGQKRHPLGVWTLLVGETGRGRKGTALGMARELMDGAYPDFMDLHEAMGITSGAGVIKYLAERQGEAAEAAADADERGETPAGLNPNDGRVIFLEEEYVTVMNRAKRDGSLSGVLRQAWDGNTLASMTAKNGARVSGAHVVIHGHTVPREFRTAISGTDIQGGTYNRLLTFHVQRSRRLPIGHTIPSRALETAHDALRAGLGFARKVKRVGFSSTALDLLNGELREEIESWDEGDDTVRAFANRADVQVMRIAALYALMDQRRQIEPRDLRAAWALVRYALESVAHLMGAGAADGLEARIRTLVVQAGATGIKSAELYRKLGRLADSAAIATAIDAMPEVTRETRRGAGRPSTIYRWSVVAPTAREPEPVVESRVRPPAAAEQERPERPARRTPSSQRREETTAEPRAPRTPRRAAAAAQPGPSRVTVAVPVSRRTNGPRSNTPEDPFAGLL
ncbi:DUF3987 domain-containing protein [Yinghuangia sp. YIM S09857]|uniref:DUF3987 domain-containing protein n=1 Tax=Yinghuangia sp. YIM S09857 TaxID=3436929 RepID=UPI003F529CAE